MNKRAKRKLAAIVRELELVRTTHKVSLPANDRTVTMRHARDIIIPLIARKAIRQETSKKGPGFRYTLTEIGEGLLAECKTQLAPGYVRQQREMQRALIGLKKMAPMIRKGVTTLEAITEHMKTS